MKIIIISNYLTHHLSYVCESLIDAGTSVLFVACEPIPDYRLSTGFSDMNNKEFVTRTYDPNFNLETTLDDIDTADAVIIGSGDSRLIKNRIVSNKLFFRFSEHLSKSKFFFINQLRLLKWKLALRSEIKRDCFFLLCSSYWAKKDYLKIGIAKNKMLKWGYFPSTDFQNKTIQNNKNSFVWAGRMIGWKHPEYIKHVYNYCFKNDIKASFEAYGDGSLFKRLQKSFKKTSIGIHKSVRREEMSSILKKGTIFLFTSDQGEGWGAILNEAMSLGCICVCNCRAGSSKYLISHGHNGFLYSNRKEFSKCIETILNLSDEERNTISNEAIATIQDLWNPRIAAINLVKQIESIKCNGEIDGTIVGPCSKVE